MGYPGVGPSSLPDSLPLSQPLQSGTESETEGWMGSGVGGPGRPFSFVASKLCNFGQGGCVPGTAVWLKTTGIYSPSSG